jgi:aldehyde dehydrogenase (NAD+)
MKHLQFFINGEWVDPVVESTIDVINPANEQVYTRISGGSAEDVDKAVAAARAAFETFSQWSVHARLQLLQRIYEVYETRMEEIADAISQEMGAPVDLARGSQVRSY